LNAGVMQSKPVRAGYKPRACDFGIFSWSVDGPEYLGIPAPAIDVKEEAAAAILARWKGHYKVKVAESKPEGRGPERLFQAANKSFYDYSPLHNFTSVHINDDSMCFSGGSTDYTTGGNSEGQGGGVINNLPVALKLTLRRGVDDELYLDNLGSRIIEDSPTSSRSSCTKGARSSWCGPRHQ